MLEKVVFLDRDGVINQDSSEYVKNWSEFIFLPGSKTAIRQLTENGFSLIIITNQSIINRKLVSRSVLDDIHTRMKAIIESEGGKIRDIIFCPHTPEERCGCRKPKPGMIHKAKKIHGIDLGTVFLVGDSVKDIECGKNAGCRFTLLVKTGNGIASERILKKNNQYPDHVARDLKAAASWIINTHKEIKYD